MKDASLTQLLLHSPTAAIVCKGDSLKWQNLAFEQLSKQAQSTLTNWARSEQGSCTLLEDQVYIRQHLKEYSLITQAAAASPSLAHNLTRALLTKLKQGSDPFYALPELLSSHLGWDHVQGTKLSTDNSLIRVGDFCNGNYQPPQTVDIDSDASARLYTGSSEACLVHEESKVDKNWLAVRVQFADNRPFGHLWLGKPGKNSPSMTESLQLVQMCASLAANWLSDTQESEQQPPLPSDALTGLASREALDRLLQQCELVYREQSHDFLLAMIDIDGLSNINQSLGQRAGDELLCQFADQLRHICRASDRLFRFGGDEFVILFHQDDLAPPLHERLDRINKRLSKEMGQAFHSSYGTAALSEARGSGDELLLLADSRLRKAKSRN